MVLRNSDDLTNTVLVRLRPYIQALGPPITTEAWINAASNAVRQVVSNILRSLVTEHQIPHTCVMEPLDYWLVRICNPVHVQVRPGLVVGGYELVVANLGLAMQEVFAPRIPTSNFVRSIRREASNTPDNFTLSLEERALRDTISPPQADTHQDGRARMAARLQEELRLEHERKVKAAVGKKEIEKTGFGRLIDLDD